jgi:methyl-accepting chemotaxis protein
MRVAPRLGARRAEQLCSQTLRFWKILGLSTIQIIVGIGISIFAIVQMSKIGGEIEEIATEDIPLTAAFSSISMHQSEQAILFERVLRIAPGMATNPDVAVHFKEIDETFVSLGHKIAQEIKDAEELLKFGIEHAHSEEAREEFQALLVAIEQVEKEYAEYEQLSEGVLATIRDGGSLAHDGLIEKIEAEEESIHHAVSASQQKIEAFTARSIVAAENHEKAAAWLLMVITAITTAAAIAIAILITRRLLGRCKI